ERPRTAARRTDRQLQRLLPLACLAVVEPATRSRRAAELAAPDWRRPARTERGVPVGAPVRARPLAGREEHAADRQGAAAVDRAGGSLARAERAWRRREGATGGDAAARGADERTDAVLQADRTVQQMSVQRPLPGRQHEAARRILDKWRRGLQGVLVLVDRALRDRAELRRQRDVLALPDRQRRSDDPLGADVVAGHQHQRAAPARARLAATAGHAPSVPEIRARVQDARAVLHADAAGIQRPALAG